MVCSAEVAAAAELAAGVPAGRGPAQGCLHRSAGTAGIRGSEQSVAQADLSLGMGWRQMVRSPILELPVVEQRWRLRSHICSCETHIKQGKAWPRMTKHRPDPTQRSHFPWVDRSPCGLLVWLTDPCSDVWDPANEIITSSKSQSCFVGTMSFLSSLHL